MLCCGVGTNPVRFGKSAEDWLGTRKNCLQSLSTLPSRLSQSTSHYITTRIQSAPLIAQDCELQCIKVRKAKHSGLGDDDRGTLQCACDTMSSIDSAHSRLINVGVTRLAAGLHQRSEMRCCGTKGSGASWLSFSEPCYAVCPRNQRAAAVREDIISPQCCQYALSKPS